MGGMFERITDRVSTRLAESTRIVGATALAAVLAIIGATFLCIAGFVTLAQHYGTVAAALAAAVLFLLGAGAIALYGRHLRALQKRRQLEDEARRAAELLAGARGRDDPLTDPQFVVSLARVLRSRDVLPLLPLVAAIGVGLGLKLRRGRGPESGG